MLVDLASTLFGFTIVPIYETLGNFFFLKIILIRILNFAYFFHSSKINIEKIFFFF